MKQKWLVRILLILLEAVLLFSAIGMLASGGFSPLPFALFCGMGLLVGYCLYRSFARPRASRAYLLRVEKTYADYLQGVFETDPKHRHTLLAALAASSLGARPRAVWKRLLALLPYASSGREQATILFFAGRAATLAGDEKAAEGLYLCAIEGETKIASAYANLSVIYQNRREYEKAEEYAKTALSLDPESVVKHTNLANLYILMRRTEDARCEAKHALSKNDKAVDAYAVLALAAAIDKNKAEANRYVRKCVDLGMEEAMMSHMVSSLLRGDMSVLSPAEKTPPPAGTKKQKTK